MESEFEMVSLSAAMGRTLAVIAPVARGLDMRCPEGSADYAKRA